MNQKEWLELHKSLCEKMMSITKAKNSDYNKGTDDAFANFKMVEHLNIADVETGFLTRMTDKISRINALVQGKQKQQVKDEAVEDTLLDLANYCLLFIGYLKDKKHVTDSKAYLSPAEDCLRMQQKVFSEMGAKSPTQLNVFNKGATYESPKEGITFTNLFTGRTEHASKEEVDKALKYLEDFLNRRGLNP